MPSLVFFLVGVLLAALQASPSFSQENAAFCNTGSIRQNAVPCLEIVSPPAQGAARAHERAGRGSTSDRASARIPTDTYARVRISAHEVAEERVNPPSMASEQVKTTPQVVEKVPAAPTSSVRIQNAPVAREPVAQPKEPVAAPVNQPLTLSPHAIAIDIRKGAVLRLHRIRFDYNSARLRPESRKVLEPVANVLRSDPGLKVIIEGHTDSKGTERYNLRLSQRRAEAVKKALVKLGIKAARLKTRGYGESRPLASNKTTEGRALNRRVEIRKW